MLGGRIATAWLAVALVAGACGSTGPTPAPATAVPAASVAAATVTPTLAPASAPAPTPAPTPTPTPAPVDASNAFIQTMSGTGVSANVTVEGQATIGSAVTSVAGTMALSGPGSDVDATSTAGKKHATSHKITSSGQRYAESKGLWFAAGAAATDDVPALLRSIESGVTDLGVEVKNGQSLHHLQITPPDIAAAAIGVPAKGASNVVTTMDAWTDDAGAPVVMELGATWSQATGKKTADAAKTLELAFSDVGGSVSVVAPAQVWKWNTSKRFRYTMAYPTDWQFEKGSKKYSDAYWGYDGDRVYVASASSAGLSLGQLSSGIKRYLPKILVIKGLKITSNKPGKLGSLPARVIEYSYTVGKSRNYSVMYLAVKGGRYWIMSYDTTGKTTGDDRDMAAKFAGSFKTK